MIVTVDQAKAFCGISHSTHDAILPILIAGVEDWIARRCSTAFVPTVETVVLPGGGQSLALPKRPVIAIVALEDLANDETWDADDYQLINGSRIVSAPPGVLWDVGPWEVQYAYGYAANPSTTTAAPVVPYTGATRPPVFDLVVLQMLRRAYDNKGGTLNESAAGWSVAWDNLIDGQISAMLDPFIPRGV